MSVSNCNSKNTRQIAVFSIVIAGLRHTCTQTLRAATHIATVVRSPWQQRVATGGGGGEGGDEWPSRVGGDEVGRATRGSVAGDDSGLKRDLCVGGSCQREGRGASHTAPAPSTTLPGDRPMRQSGRREAGGAGGWHTALADDDDAPVPAGAFREAPDCHGAHGRCAQPKLDVELGSGSGSGSGLGSGSGFGVQVRVPVRAQVFGFGFGFGFGVRVRVTSGLVRRGGGAPPAAPRPQRPLPPSPISTPRRGRQGEPATAWAGDG